MIAGLFCSSDYDRSLRRRRLAGIGLAALGALGCGCYVLLLRQNDSLPPSAQAFYLGFSCGLALAGLLLFLRAQYLLSHPQAQKRARIQERDERERSITLRAFQLAGLVTFYLCAAALLVAVTVDQTIAEVLLGVMAVYAASFLLVRCALSRQL